MSSFTSLVQSIPALSDGVLLDEEKKTHRQAYEICSTTAAHLLWTIIYIVIEHVATGGRYPPTHVLFVIIIFFLQDTVKISCSSVYLWKLRKEIYTRGLESHKLALPWYRKAIVSGILDGLIASGTGELLTSACDVGPP